MVHLSAGGLLYDARIKQMRTSLDRVAKIAALDKRTIKRYEDGELMIPRKLERILANEYFRSDKAKREFLKKCREERINENQSIKERRKRRAERAVAGRLFEVQYKVDYKSSSTFVLARRRKREAHNEPLPQVGDAPSDQFEDRLLSAINNAFKDDLPKKETDALLLRMRQKYAGISLCLFITDRKSGEVVCEISEFGIRFFTLGNKSPQSVIGNAAIEEIFSLARHRNVKIGRFALLDLADEELKNLDVFGKYKSKEEGIVILEKSTIAELIALLEGADKSKSSRRDQFLDTAKIILHSIHSRFDDVQAAKEKLLHVIDGGREAIAIKLQLSIS